MYCKSLVATHTLFIHVVQIRYCNFAGSTQSAVNTTVIHQPVQNSVHSEQPEQRSGKH